MVGSELQTRLGRNLRRIRQQRRLSQEEFAEVLKIHRTYVGGLERGERNPSLLVIERLARALDVEPLELLQDDDASSQMTMRAAATGDGHDLPDARRLGRAKRH